MNDLDAPPPPTPPNAWTVHGVVGGNEITQTIDRQIFNIGTTVTVFYNTHPNDPTGRVDPVYIPNSQIARIETLTLVHIPDSPAALTERPPTDRPPDGGTEGHDGGA